MRAPPLLMIAPVVLACRGPGPVAPPLPETRLAAAAFTPRQGRYLRGPSELDASTDEDRLAFSRLDRFWSLDELTRGVIESAGFRPALEHLPQVDVSPGSESISGHMLARAVLGELAGYDLARTCFRIKPCCGATATTEIVQDCDHSTGRFAAIAIREVVLARVEAIPEGLGCAINTLAHEWTHAIVDRDDHMVFLDAGHQHVDDAVASYTVGAVAQCVYLQRWRPELELDACVRAAGTHTFRPCTCDPGWLDALIAGDTACKDPPPPDE